MSGHLGAGGGEDRSRGRIGPHDRVARLRDDDGERRAVTGRLGDLDQHVDRTRELLPQVARRRRGWRLDDGGVEGLHKDVVDGGHAAGCARSALAEYIRLREDAAAGVPARRALGDLRDQIGGQGHGQRGRGAGGGTALVGLQARGEVCERRQLRGELGPLCEARGSGARGQHANMTGEGRAFFRGGRRSTVFPP